MVTASYGHYGQRAARIGPDRICRIRLSGSFSVPFFRRKQGPYCAKSIRIRSGWPGQGLAKRIWSESKLVFRNHRAGFWQDATGPLPVSHFQTRFRSFTNVPDNIIQNQPESDLVLADCQVLAKRIRSGSKPMCKNHPARFWPMLPSRSGLDANPDPGMFTEVGTGPDSYVKCFSCFKTGIIDNVWRKQNKTKQRQKSLLCIRV